MARNRRNQSAAVRFGPALKAVLLCLFIGGAGMGYVWQQSQIYHLGKLLKQRENRREELVQTNKRLAHRLDELRSPTALDERVKKLNLGLAPAQPGQIIRLVDAPPKVAVSPPGVPPSTAQTRLASSR